MSTLQNSKRIGQHDDRLGLGYGAVSTSGYHVSRKSSSYFPYTDPDNYEQPEEDMLDDEMLDAFISKVNGDYVPIDSERAAGNDPFYFVGASTRLVACFLRPNDVLVEVDAVARRLGLGPRLGAAEPITNRADGRVRMVPTTGVPTLKIGSDKGYFGRPPAPVETDLENVPTPDEIDQVSVWSLEDTPSDDERALIKIRRAIDAIHQEQELAEMAAIE